jgi:hypothetical protein
MKRALSLMLMLLAAPSPPWAAVEAIKSASTPADNKPNDPSVPDA